MRQWLGFYISDIATSLVEARLGTPGSCCREGSLGTLRVPVDLFEELDCRYTRDSGVWILQGDECYG